MTAAGAIVHVKIGHIECAGSPHTLKATLGSCVGIALLWPQAGRAALAHCLLPSSALAAKALHDRAADVGPARCVDQAVPALLALLDVPAGQRRQVQAHLAGGAHLRALASSLRSTGVGALNIRAAREALGAAGLRISGERVGGDLPIQIVVDCADLRVDSWQIADTD